MLSLIRAWLHGPHLTPAVVAPDAAWLPALELNWRLINAELGLCAWVARLALAPGTSAPLPSSVLALLAQDETASARSLACQLARAQPGCLVVLPLVSAERLSAASVPYEVALHTLLQRLRYEGQAAAAAPALLHSARMHAAALRYAERYRVHALHPWQTTDGPASLSPGVEPLPAWA